jgi:hypothetical protein
VSRGTTPATSDRAEHVPAAAAGGSFLSGSPDRAEFGAERGIRSVWVEAALALAAFAVLCAVVLPVAPQAAEPDDGAYHASIVAMTEGHSLTLSTAQAETLAGKLGDTQPRLRTSGFS